MGNALAKIMIVDDVIANLIVTKNLIKSHYEIYLAPSAAQMFTMLEKIQPDLILLDIEMPGMDGYEALANLKMDERFAGIPVMLLTAKGDEASELRGFDLGAVDYINKPFSQARLLRRIEHQLLIVWQRKTIQRHMDNLAVLVSEKISEVVSLQNTILTTVADLVEFRDQSTGGHIARTQLYLRAMLDELREKKLYADRTVDWDMDYVLQSAQLHDVGKIGISDAILNKPAQLTPGEMEIMKTHVVIGVDAINKIISRTESHAFLRHAYNIIRGHHEKWDGTGYPYGLKGEDIPLEGRLMAVADVYDALVSVRPYKKAFSHDEACKMIEADAGKYFDPALVDVFLNVKSKFKRTSSDNNLADRENVNLLTLTKDMEVGVPAIDAQHRELIDRMNNVIAVGAHPISKEKAQQALDFLGKYVIKHFSDEEDLQKQSRYPKHNVHKSQHQVLIGELRKLRLEFAANAISDTLMRKLNNSIIQWVLSHIKGSDVEFGKYYQLRDSISRGAEADKAAEEKSLNLNEIEGLDGAGSTAGPYTVQDRVP